jgi:hypothetical protein
MHFSKKHFETAFLNAFKNWYMKKSIFSQENANISQLFLLDKLVSGQGL